MSNEYRELRTRLTVMDTNDQADCGMLPFLQKTPETVVDSLRECLNTALQAWYEETGKLYLAREPESF